MYYQPYNAAPQCPQCGSTWLTTHKKGGSLGKGCLAFFVAGPALVILLCIIMSIGTGNFMSALPVAIGFGATFGLFVSIIVAIAAGTAGRNRVVVTCVQCGYSYEIGG